MGSNFASALRAGAQIGPTAKFNAFGLVGSYSLRPHSGGNATRGWIGALANDGKGVRDRYVGLKFTIGSETHYGWIRISVNVPNPSKKGIVVITTGYAYETEANKPIVAGATSDDIQAAIAPDPLTPMPSSLGLLARGADSLAIWRREENSVSR